MKRRVSNSNNARRTATHITQQCMLLQPCLKMYYIFSVLFLLFVWCSCMAINASVQYNSGLLPGIILLPQCYYHRGTRLNAMKRLCICSLRSHLNVFTFLPLTGGCSEGLGAFIFLFKQLHLAQQLTLIFLLLYVILNAVFKNQLPHRGERLPVQRRCSIHHVAAIIE